MKKAVVIGNDGQLGTDLLRVAAPAGWQLTGLHWTEIDIGEMDSVTRALDQVRPDAVLNTAAAHSAKQSTTEEQRQFFNVNTLGAWNLARWCATHDAVLVHYSTDYAFGAERTRATPYAESDPPCPTTIYGASKVAGEELVKRYCPKHYVIRVASLYGEAGCRAKNDSNFVKMTLGKIQAGESMKVVNDQWMSPTWTRKVAEKTLAVLAAAAPFGLYHMAGSGRCTWYEFAQRIVELMGSRIGVEPTATPDEAPGSLVVRPRFTALDNAALRGAGLSDLTAWQDAVAEFLRQTTAAGR